MPNMASHISSHNKNIIQEPKKSQHPNPKKCDWAENCPLNGNCKQSAVIYQADLTPEIDNKRTYIGLTEGPFKDRIYKNTKINQNYLLLSGKQKIWNRISKLSGW